MEHAEAGEGRTKTRVKHDEDRRMKIALIDVDGHNFPSLPLMKISAYHKQRGDIVAWYDPLTAWKNPPDRVYMSKVFTFTPDYPHPVNAGEVIKGGTGYSYPDGKPDLPDEIEHIFPDYHLYRKQVFVPEEKTGDEETGRAWITKKAKCLNRAENLNWIRTRVMNTSADAAVCSACSCRSGTPRRT